jgi:hypothetical protein
MTNDLLERVNVWAETIGQGWKADNSSGPEVEGALYIKYGRVSLRKMTGKQFRYMYPNGVLIAATIDKQLYSSGNTPKEALELLLSRVYGSTIDYEGFDADVAEIVRVIANGKDQTTT